jgi:hypothetical protein
MCVKTCSGIPLAFLHAHTHKAHIHKNMHTLIIHHRHSDLHGQERCFAQPKPVTALRRPPVGVILVGLRDLEDDGARRNSQVERGGCSKSDVAMASNE